MTLDQLAIWFSVAVGVAAGVRALLRRRTFTDLTRPFDEAEAEAKRRGDTRAIGKARKDRREAVHASLRRAA